MNNLLASTCEQRKWLMLEHYVYNVGYGMCTVFIKISNPIEF